MNPAPRGMLSSNAEEEQYWMTYDCKVMIQVLSTLMKILCIACDQKAFCGAWCGKGRSKTPHNFFSADRNEDYLKGKMTELGHCFDAITM